MRQILFDQLISRRPLILGHRGVPLELTENTVASFLRALEEGADGVELDVRQTGDGRLVVFHDDCLQSGELLRDYPLEDLRTIARLHNVELNSLEETMQALAGKGFLNIELKELGTAAPAIDLARLYMPLSNYVFSSFLPTVVRECRHLAPDVPAIYITDTCRDLERVFHILESSDASGLGLWHEALTPPVGAFFTERRVPLFVWTVNDPEEACRLAGMLVAGIITDVPGALRAALT